jgi:hypothetical protein
VCVFQYFRTAMHYVYGQEDNKQLVNLLMDYGASEFTMDKVGTMMTMMMTMMMMMMMMMMVDDR